MYRIVAALGVRLRTLQALWQSDRGETGPIQYAVMVSAIVLIALFVAAWGEDVARFFMSKVEGVDAGGGG